MCKKKAADKHTKYGNRVMGCWFVCVHIVFGWMIIMILLYGKFVTNFSRSPCALCLVLWLFAISESISFIIFQYETVNVALNCVTMLLNVMFIVHLGEGDRLHCITLYCPEIRNDDIENFLFILSFSTSLYHFAICHALEQCFDIIRQCSRNIIFFMLILLHSECTLYNVLRYTASMAE